MGWMFGLALAPLGCLRNDFLKELLGMIILIFLTCTPGTWIGASAWWQSWMLHGVGVVVADWVAAGPNVNPSVSFAMFALGVVSYPVFLCRVSGQVLGAVIAFPLARTLARELDWRLLPGPTFDPAKVPTSHASWDEAAATFSLCMSIFVLNWVVPFRKVYLMKQSATAACVRGCLQAFPTAGPAMNPALATGWAFSANSEAPGGYAFPSDAPHYVCYWASSFLGAFLASFAFGVCAGMPFLGVRFSPRLNKVDGNSKDD